MDSQEYAYYIPILKGPARQDIRDAINALRQIQRKPEPNPAQLHTRTYLSFKCKGYGLNWRLGLTATRIVQTSSENYEITCTGRFYIARTLKFDTGLPFVLRPGENYIFVINYQPGSRTGRISSIAVGTPIKNPPS